MTMRDILERHIGAMTIELVTLRTRVAQLEAELAKATAPPPPTPPTPPTPPPDGPVDRSLVVEMRTGRYRDDDPI